MLITFGSLRVNDINIRNLIIFFLCNLCFGSVWPYVKKFVEIFYITIIVLLPFFAQDDRHVTSSCSMIIHLRRWVMGKNYIIKLGCGVFIWHQLKFNCMRLKYSSNEVRLHFSLFLVENIIKSLLSQSFFWIRCYSNCLWKLIYLLQVCWREEWRIYGRNGHS